MEDPFKPTQPALTDPKTIQDPYAPDRGNTTNADVFQPRNYTLEKPQSLVATRAAQTYLYSSKGWVRFMSVLAFIYFALMLLGLLNALGIVGDMYGGSGVLIIVLVVIMIGVVFALGLRLSKFSSAVGRLEISRDAWDLEVAMVQQLKFWRLCGILTIILLFLTLIVFVLG